MTVHLSPISIANCFGVIAAATWVWRQVFDVHLCVVATDPTRGIKSLSVQKTTMNKPYMNRKRKTLEGKLDVHMSFELSKSYFFSLSDLGKG